jgi:hypothetical protein
MVSPPEAKHLALSPWLEVVDGNAPLLLIAPHGGRAGAAARGTLHPKVNDLETAAITRELARRLGASALINAGMDRNELDCNRLSQLTAQAPWILELIARGVDQIVTRHGHATVLLIHGWNIIEPRVDLGLGLRETGGSLRPPAGAHVSASDEFINGPVAELAKRLRAAKILPSFGLRYPGGTAQNLLQAFTMRHGASGLESLRRLAALAEQHAIDALQLEMSVALRLPGELRALNLDAISEIFSPRGRGAITRTLTIPIHREAAPRPKKTPSAAGGALPPTRIGIEFYDPDAKIGAMVSFDFGAGAAGGRIMALFDRCRVAIFTAEGRAQRAGDRISLGPLALHAGARQGALEFRGPAAVVDDGTSYMSVERALAGSRLEAAMEVAATLEIDQAPHTLDELITRLEATIAAAHRAGATSAEIARIVPPAAAFARLRGTIAMDGAERIVDAVARIGVSFTGIGPQKFTARRMLWASFPSSSGVMAIEARALTLDGGAEYRIARVLSDGEWREGELAEIDLNTQSPMVPPARVGAVVTVPGTRRCAIHGTPGSFMTLSRPGPDGTRIHTSLGFAAYRIGAAEGAGMFEYSHRADPPTAAGASLRADRDA